MTRSAYKTLPCLKGTVAVSTPFGTLLGKAEHLVYPYQLGAMVTVSSVSVVTTLTLSGLGDLAVNDYILPCRPVSYGGTVFYVPDTTNITRVVSIDPSYDKITVSPGIQAIGYSYLFNLGADTASTPLLAPNYDGSTISLYADPVGSLAASNPYLITNPGGNFIGWVESGVQVCSVLICNSSGTPVLAIPQFQCGLELLA